MDKKQLIKAKIDLLRRSKQDIVNIWPLECRCYLDRHYAMKDAAFGWTSPPNSDTYTVSLIQTIECKDHESHAVIFHWKYNRSGLPLEAAEITGGEYEKPVLKHGIGSTIWYLF